MLVYGDRSRRADPEGERARTEAARRDASDLQGLSRDDGRLAAFIALAEVVQGLADQAMAATGADDPDSATEAGMVVLRAMASELLGLPSSVRTVFEAFDAWRGMPLPARVTCKQAEGYAFYALDPLAYAAAAVRSGLGPATRVIGLRSIGVGLAAMVAAALGAGAVTLRPHGDPFHRRVTPGPRTAAWLLGDPDCAFAIVDEGPGLSGSSFGGVADWLEEHGVERARIHFFPSHAGEPGPQASTSHLARWRELPRHVLSFEEAVEPGLAAAAEEVLRPLDGPPVEISGGGWRSLVWDDPAEWPASNIQQERRKFIVTAGGRRWLMKFAGFGDSGPRKLRRAQALAEAGWTPRPEGLRRGFLIEEWRDDTARLDRSGINRGDLIAQLGAYLGFRARTLPADTPGASLAELLFMARRNAGLALGPGASDALAAWEARLPALQATVRSVETDNRMHAWEWRVTPEGRLLKTDAVDHCEAHDLVGCQDIAWDVAGASVAFDLSGAETERLRAVAGAEAGHPVAPDLLAFLLPCYAAFQLGAASLAADALAGTADADRLRRDALRYAGALRAMLGE